MRSEMFGVATLVGIAISTGGGTGAAAAARHVGMLDCNGFSAIQAPIARIPCAEVANGKGGDRFEDNGHYVGHDEPSVQFFSRKPGSGNRVTYRLTLPREPSTVPSGTFNGPVWDFQNELTFWFSMAMCDTQSYPEGIHRCTPDSDTNAETIPTPTHAGAAFTELQFYPPGYQPFSSKISCSRTQWCAALTIDSVQANFGFVKENPNCTEPVNFAWEQRDGAPTGPPGPDTATLATFTPNSQTLRMNQGDKIVLSMHDAPSGLVTVVRDVTIHETGRMAASISNGFRHIVWDPANFACNGRPYAFHPMYDTAKPPTAAGQPRAFAQWTAHTSNVSISWEIGHFERPDGDPDDADCTQGPMIPGCLMFANGDLDFDGYSYRADWPDGSARHPSQTFVTSPTTAGSQYRLARFETDIPVNEILQNCERKTTGANCTDPPKGARFYPWYHTASALDGCAFSFGNDFPGMANNFGGEEAEYGPLELTNYGSYSRYDNFASGTVRNPCLSSLTGRNTRN